MYRAAIAVVDASRARLFTFERSSEAAGIRDELVEQRDLVNPARRIPYAADDHRDARIAEVDKEFSHLVIAQLVEVVRAAHVERVILCASPRMLGELRAAGRELPPEVVAIDELARDFVKLPPAQLREHLASHGLLPVARA